MQIQLSDHFTFKKLFRFVFPSVIMMVFTSVYGVVDGFFVSNFVGKTPFAAVNLIMPVTQILGAFGFMFGTGGSALVARTLGEGKRDKANKIFSLLVYTAIILGVLLGLTGIIFIRPIAMLLGAEGELVEMCAVYARIILAVLPAFMLQVMFQSFTVTAEKPQLGLFITILSGVTNIVLDALLTAVFKFGIAGAAAATAISQVVGGIVPLIYFAAKNTSALRLVKTKFDKKALLFSLANGSSEFVTNISVSIVSMIYNIQLMKYAGENGIAAYGVIMYVSFIFIAVFLGYSIGVAPIIGYNQGSGNDAELKNVFKRSMRFVVVTGIIMTVFAFGFAKPFTNIFVGYDAELSALTEHALRLYSYSFLFCGFGIFGSALFTALNNGAVSALISFLRTLVFQSLSVIILPAVLEIEGVWYSITVAEVLAAAVALIFIFKYRGKYRF